MCEREDKEKHKLFSFPHTIINVIKERQSKTKCRGCHPFYNKLINYYYLSYSYRSHLLQCLQYIHSYQNIYSHSKQNTYEAKIKDAYLEIKRRIKYKLIKQFFVEHS